MGNWRRVQIIGTCDESDVRPLRVALDPGRDYSNFHPLVCGGICGLPNWAKPEIAVVGNLAERGYDADSVAETLTDLAKTAPSLRVKVHCGSDYEDAPCTATVTLGEDGVAIVGPPEVEAIPDLDEGQMHRNMLAQLSQHR